MIAIVNAKTLGVSEYALSPVDVVAHDGKLFLVDADALRVFGQEQDADEEGVLGYVETGDLDLDQQASLSFREARLGLLAEGAMELNLTAHQNGGQKAVDYPVPVRAGVKSQDRVVRLGRGVVGNAWRLRLAAAEAGAWALQSLALTVDRRILRRR